tara:strand:- start:520 stop:1728 length:1209 start_codon:yes stop_codon:yes gene_type:complete
MKNEIEKYAEKLGVSPEQAQSDYDEIVTKHNLDVNDENGYKIARSLFRSKFGQQLAVTKKETEGDAKAYDGPTYTKTATGFFYAVEDARDWEAGRRTSLLAEYNRDANACLNSGNVAVALSLTDGRYEVTMLSNEELTMKVMEKIPESAMEIDDDKWLIPVDSRKSWANGQPNKSYGKPLPAESWSRRLFFIGKLNNEGEYGTYQVRMSGEQCKDFSPNTFSWCEFTCVPNSNNASILSARKDGSTVSSLKYLESDEDMITIVQSLLQNSISELKLLESYHTDNSHKQSHERIMITDGNVTGMNLQQTTNGNQTLFLSDLDGEMNWDDDSSNSVACWVPNYIDIDFGIGSNVIVCGRTSQSTDKETGQLRNVSINVLGLYVIDKHGTANVGEQPVEDDFDWF